MEQWKINTMLAFIEKVKGLKKNSVYLSSKTERTYLASLYKQALTFGDGFPKPQGFSSNLPKTLQKRVNNTCPSCVKEKVMKSVIDSAVQSLNYYSASIQKQIDGIDQVDNSTNVHDLKPS